MIKICGITDAATAALAAEAGATAIGLVFADSPRRVSARQAAEIDPGMKIMFITGFAAVALNPANRAPEDAKILSKPFHLRDLVQEVERMVAA